MLLLALLISCTTDSYVTTNRCDITIENTSPTEATINETLTIEAYPMTEEWDTLVLFNNTSAVVESISKVECQECEDCRQTNLCTECDYCDVCIAVCDSCIHTLDVLVPEVFSEQVDVTILNAQGSSDPFPISIRQE